MDQAVRSEVVRQRGEIYRLHEEQVRYVTVTRRGIALLAAIIALLCAYSAVFQVRSPPLSLSSSSSLRACSPACLLDRQGRACVCV